MAVTMELVSDATISFCYFFILVAVILVLMQNLPVFKYLMKHGSYFKVAIVLQVCFIFLNGLRHFTVVVEECQSTRMGSQMGDILKVVTAVVSGLTAVFFAVSLPKILEATKQVEFAERGLTAELQHTHKAVFDKSTHMISVHDQKDGRFLFVNSACTKFGVQKGELLNSTVFELVDEGSVKSIRAALKTLQEGSSGMVSRVLCRMRNLRYGKRTQVEASMFFGRYTTSIEEEETLFIVWNDVADSVEGEEDGVIQQPFISSMAHDLKTPLTSFQLSLSLLNDSAWLGEEERLVIQEAEMSVELMSVAICQAIDFHRIGADSEKNLRPKRGSLDLHNLVYKCEKTLSHFPDKMVPIQSIIASNVARVIITDGDWIWQMKEGCVRLELRLIANVDPTVEELVHGIVRSRPLTGEGQSQSQSQSQSNSDSDSNTILQEEAEASPRGEEVKSNDPPPGGLARNRAGSGGPSEGRQSDSESRQEQQLFLCFVVNGKGRVVAPPPESATKDVVLQPFVVAEVEAQETSSPIVGKDISQTIENINGVGMGLYTVGQKAKRLSGKAGMVTNTRAEDGSICYFTIPYVPDSNSDLEPSSSSEEDTMTQGLVEGNNNSTISEGNSRASMTPATNKPSRSSERAEQQGTDPNDTVLDTMVATSASAGSGKGGGAPRVNGEVLIVDDSTVVCNLLSHAVRKLGYGVGTAGTGEEALVMMKNKFYDLVICDLQMPVLDGPECVRRFRLWEEEHRKDKPRQIIFGMSANDEHTDIELSRSCGMDSFCPKPMRLGVLKAVIALCIDVSNTRVVERGVQAPVMKEEGYAGNQRKGDDRSVAVGSSKTLGSDSGKSTSQLPFRVYRQ